MRPAIREKKISVRDSESLSVVQQQTVRLISWSKPIRDGEGWIGRGPDTPVRVCTFEDACAAAVRQREIEREVSSREARSSFSQSALFSDRLTVPPWFCDRWIYRKIKQTPLFSKLRRFSTDFALKHVLWRHRNAHSVKERLFLSSKNGMNSFAFSSCPIYKSYIGQTNRKRNKSALLVWAIRRRP